MEGRQDRQGQFPYVVPRPFSGNSGNLLLGDRGSGSDGTPWIKGRIQAKRPSITGHAAGRGWRRIRAEIEVQKRVEEVVEEEEEKGVDYG
ncbi:hypothetical protein CRENBAI_002962 [Crenichthys baileyi]|uniref:Uncharacterized protein n=1 Tax=Crenichthys baileyi TaxID=28760 RepID=A0AAV9RCG0_9TELE